MGRNHFFENNGTKPAQFFAMVTNVTLTNVYFQAAEVGRNKKKKVAGAERCWCA